MHIYCLFLWFCVFVLNGNLPFLITALLPYCGAPARQQTEEKRYKKSCFWSIKILLVNSGIWER